MRKLTNLAAENQVQGPVGHSHKHDSAQLHVTGKATYVDDIPRYVNTHYAAVGLSTIASGRISSIDLSSVKQSPGVVDVVVYDDIPGEADVAPVFTGDLLFANQTIDYAGQPIFAVLAKTVEQARQAVLRAKIEYETSLTILTAEQSHDANEFVRPAHKMARGNVAMALSQSALVLDGQVEIGGQEHLYLEGQVGLAIVQENNQIVIHTSTQHPSEVQKLVAEVLDLPLNKVTVDVRRMGGGFGGKETQAAPWACMAALLAMRNQCPVKLRLPRYQDMIATGKRHPFSNKFKIGVSHSGVIRGADIQINGLCGHSADLSDAIVDRAMFHADNAYYLPDCQVVGHRCRTNTVSHTAFRGFGGPQGMVVAEAMIEKIARAVKQDPLTVRKANLYDSVSKNTTHYGMEVEQDLLMDLIETLETNGEYWARRAQIKAFNEQSPIIKKGLALTPVKFGISFTAKHLNQAGALVHVYTDGSIQVNHGGTEMGQGLHTKVCQIAARVFGVSLDQVQITSTRTDKVPNTSPTAASSGADLNGMAVKNACETIAERLAHCFAEQVGESVENVRFEHGNVIAGGHQISFSELVQQAYLARISLSSTGYYRTPKIHYDRESGKGRPFFYFACGAALSEVSIDTLTGEYKVNQVDILHDVGDSLNPAIDKGQIEGGFIQGMGWVTTEELKWNDAGQLLSHNPATYKIPAIGDTPEVLNVELFSKSNLEKTVYSSKAVGEPPFMLALSVWCALKDAIASVSNYQQDPDLPIPATPERVLAAIDAIETQQQVTP